MFILQRSRCLTVRSHIRCSMDRNFSKKTGGFGSVEDEINIEGKKTGKEQMETAAKKLNKLLASMTTDDPYYVAQNEISMPTGSLNRRKQEGITEKGNRANAIATVKQYAGNQTEFNLLNKLLGRMNVNAQNEDIMANKTSSDHEFSLNDIIGGMKVSRNSQRQENIYRNDYVRGTLDIPRNMLQDLSKPRKSTKRKAENSTSEIKLHTAEPMGIFKKQKSLKESIDILSDWAYLTNENLEQQAMHPPSNIIKKTALWTIQKKIWPFPINNEHDWQLEESDFSNHVFLEQHLSSWCPTKGPIRHFMELVCVGLSKNPYLTAQDKKENILWYRSYFTEKRDALSEYMLHGETK